MSNQVKGYRGYIGSRSHDGGDFPQNVQNLIIRTYCQKHNLHYLLSATEYRMTGCYMILEEVLASLSSIEGIVLFSVFMLPQSAEKRQYIYQKVLDAGRSLHAALEDLSIKNVADVQMVEDILKLNKIALAKQSLTNFEEFCLA